MLSIAENMSDEDIAAEVFDFLARTGFRMLSAAQKMKNHDHALIFGGVASSVFFRQLLLARMKARRNNMNIVFGLPEYSGDNAVGVALIGAYQHFGMRTGGNYYGKNTQREDNVRKTDPGTINPS